MTTAEAASSAERTLTTAERIAKLEARYETLWLWLKEFDRRIEERHESNQHALRLAREIAEMKVGRDEANWRFWATQIVAWASLAGTVTIGLWSMSNGR